MPEYKQASDILQRWVRRCVERKRLSGKALTNAAKKTRSCLAGAA
jgi:hypothetical protein